ncbi:MFS transporter [Curtobacterium sp. Curtsp57]|uniref:MFS transporter n=1 Tax=Curtobacterium sp. Curtsp57 TaxID=3243047 RepID=UPI0039B4A1EA
MAQQAPHAATPTDAPATPSSVIVPRRWRRLAAVVAPLWADNNEGSILSTLAPVIIAAISLPLAAVGVLTSIAKFISILFGPFWAFVARKTNRKATFVITTAITGVLTALTGLAQNYAHIILFYGLSAVFIAAALPIVSEITTDLFDEKSRGRASGYTWGAISLLGSIAGPLIGQLANVHDGWRYGFFIWGGLTIVASLVLLFCFTDPGLGASEPTTAMMTVEQRAENERISWAKVRRMFGIPTFTLMLVQRLISGHLLIGSFGILFLVQTYGFSTAVAAVVTLPFGLGYLVGTFGGGIVTDALQRRFPRAGRIAVLQFAQLGFAVASLIATQFDWGTIWVFAGLWSVMGFMQGLNPGVNRPIVASVVPPELRGAAFALMLSVFEGLAYALFNLSAGFLAEAIGLKAVMFWIPGVLMLVNAAFVTLLYRTYPRDVDRLDALLQARTGSVATH